MKSGNSFKILSVIFHIPLYEFLPINILIYIDPAEIAYLKDFISCFDLQV